MKIKAVDHVGVYTTDIEKSLRFYTEVLGLELVKRIPNGDNTLVFLKINETSLVELFDFQKEIPYFERPGDVSGLAHIAFSVDGIEAWNEKLQAAGVDFTLPLCDLPHVGKKVLLFKDPNGAIIELSEDL